MKKTLLVVILMMTVQMSWAMEGMHHGGMDHGAMDHSGHSEHQQMDMTGHEHHDSGKEASNEVADNDMYMVKKEVDGYDVTFHVMPAGGMYHGGSHNLMIRIEQGGKDAEITAINSKVFFPNGADESKMLIKMGEWYMNGYDLHGNKKHGLMILFKTADGKKHKASAYYPEP